MSFLTDLEDLCPHTVTAVEVTEDERGDITPTGTTISLDKCHISIKNRLMRDKAGREVVSSTTIISLANNSLNVKDYRFTLPATFADPLTLIEAMSVELISDEGGALYERIRLP